MSTGGDLYRLSAFAESASGGNPAGVWIGEALPDGQEMQGIAAEVGYSETAFIAPRHGAARTIRYYSPEAEVSFCGHATIASGVVLGRHDGEGSYRLETAVGEVPVRVRREGDRWIASLTSVGTRQAPASPQLLDAALGILGWDPHQLDPSVPAIRAYAGAWHLVIAAKERARLSDLQYDFDRLKSLMLANELTTLQLIWRESEALFHARDPFPVGGVFEDPATGAAAAALGGYLRDGGLSAAPFRFLIRQGEDMGRPSLLTVDVPVSGGITVSGTAVDI